MLVLAVALTIGVTSCESEYSKESNELIQKYEVALSEQNLQESKKLSNLLESRELNSTQTAKVRSLNENLSGLEQEEEQREREKKEKKLFNGHDYVDLGLPSGTLWATYNIGANSPQSCGDYYAWGETTPKHTYSDENYNYESNPSTLPLSVDAASVNWGGGWRLPKQKEVEELLKECKWESISGAGLELTGPSGQKIFFPASGVRRGDYCDLKGVCGFYWTNAIDDRGSFFKNQNAYVLFVNSDGGYGFYGSISSGPRRYGCTIRAVCSPIR